MSDFVEEFRDFNGPYQVSNLGRVRNKNTGRVLKTDISTNGYERFSQWNGKKYSVHRMVAIAFLPNYNKLRIHVNHIDGNKHNNVLTNLEWCTPSENKFHSIHVLGEKKGRPPVLRGSENNLAKLNEDIVRKVKHIFSRPDIVKVSFAELAEQLGVHKSCIKKIKYGQTWRHVQ